MDIVKYSILISLKHSGLTVLFVIDICYDITVAHMFYRYLTFYYNAFALLKLNKL